MGDATDPCCPGPGFSAVKPLVEWSKEEVQDWFRKSEYSQHSEHFKLSGKALASLTKEDFQKEIGSAATGSALYSAFQELNVKKGIAWTSEFILALICCVVRVPRRDFS